MENTNEPLFTHENITEQILKSTIEVYKIVTKNLLPIPKTSHYIFNLRDVSRVIKGICLFNKNSFETIMDIKRLWLHEVSAYIL